jgi:hypothetical protein
MTTLYWIGPIFNILAIFGIITGLYIAGRLLPTFFTWLSSFFPENLLSRQIPKTILWLALGALFTSPLLDIVSTIGLLINVTLSPQRGGEFTTALGTVPSQVYFLFPLILMVVVYMTTIIFGIKYATSLTQFHRTERIFILLVIASLVFGVVNSVFTQVLSFQIPFLASRQNLGIPGYLIEVAIGFLILVIILIGLDRILSNHPASKDENS